MKTISVRVNEEESKIFDGYSKIKNVPISTLLKEALFSAIEDEYDLKVIKEYEEDTKNGDVEFIPFSEIEKYV